MGIDAKVQKIDINCKTVTFKVLTIQQNLRP